MPIFTLITFVNEWRIKVRMTCKYELRRWTKQSGIAMS